LELLHAFGVAGHGVSYNAYLTTAETGRRWLASKARRDPTYAQWKVAIEDLDSDPSVPDDVIVFDALGHSSRGCWWVLSK
jgi:hypothetical protein